MGLVGTALLFAGVIGALTGSHDHLILGFGTNGNHNALRIVAGLAALMLSWTGHGAARAGCWVYAFAYSILFIGGAGGSRSMDRAFNFATADHVFHLLIVAGCVWAATFRRRQEETEELLDMELELEEAWPQGEDLEPEESEEPVGTDRSR
jgi:hypothetical protein